jgi:hypothetical protein
MATINSILTHLKPLDTTPELETASGTLPIYILFTNPTATLSAVRTVAAYASDLNAEIEVFVPQLVPYSLPLDHPPVPTEWLERRFSALFSGFQITVQICLCRDRMEGIRTMLPAKSTIVIGASGRWWAFRERRLAKDLRRQGQGVILCVTRKHA